MVKELEPIIKVNMLPSRLVQPVTHIIGGNIRKVHLRMSNQNIMIKLKNPHQRG